MRIRVFVLFSIYSISLYSQEATVFGVIHDAISKNVVDYATIFVDGTTNVVNSDLDGLYTIKIPAQKELNLIFSRIGYKKTSYHIDKLNNGETYQINVFLAPEESKYEVVITESRIEDVGMIRENINELKLLPITSGNFESVLPSIALGTSTGTGGELSSQYNVRGGNYDENLVYVNDFEIYRPQLIQNSEQEGLSFPNPDLISTLSFSSGGFEANYGDKMSSVLDIKYKRPTSFQSSAEISMLGAAAHTEASVKLGKHDWNKLNILGGFRYKNNRYLLSSQSKKGEYEPSFIDLQAYITYNITKDIQLAYIGNLNSNVFQLTPESHVEATGTFNNAIRFTTTLEGHEEDKYINGMNGLSLTYVPDRKKNPIYLKLLSSYYSSNESQKYDIIGQYRLSQIETSYGNDNTGEEIALLGIGTQQKYTRDLLFSEIYTLKHLRY
ncbi:MAG: carboxypeptidase-like regulatory domain-containing protein [Saprospiraceae bacterium]